MRSNDQEGFYVDQPILQNVPVSINTSSRPIDFEPRYLLANKLIKREPIQVTETSPICQVLYCSSETKRRSSIKKQSQQNQEYETLEKHYGNKQVYQHVYSRYGTENNTQTFESLSDNIIPLNHLNQYSSLDYSVLKPYTFPESQKTGLLQFDSRFQGGNLSHAFYNKQTRQYHLLMQNDLNTNGYNQWFYFAVNGMRRGAFYTFNIVNYVRGDVYSQRKSMSLFEEGMLPAVYSFEGKKWWRAGRNVSYGRTNKVDGEGEGGKEGEKLYRLSFSLAGEERLMVAAGLPYSYTKLMRSLRVMEEKAQTKQGIAFSYSICGYTLGNNAVPMVTVSSSSSPTSKKKTIVITGRQHSGEVWSSYLCQQLLWQLIQNPRSKPLLQKFTFKIFPMVNVDGVIYGNFRCDMGGADLNRRWKDPCKYLQPHIFSIKQYLTNLHEKNHIEMYFDLHGHSKKMNSFCYCCSLNDDSRILPLMLSELTSLVSFEDCTFGLERCKSKTSRGFMFELCHKINILTVECSAYGYRRGNQNYHFEPKDMGTLAEMLLMSIWINMKEENQFNGVNNSMIKQKINQKREEFKQYDQNNQDDSGSDSDPEGEEMNESEKMMKVLPKKIVKLIKEQDEDKDASITKKRKKTKKNRSSVAKSNPKFTLPDNKQATFTPPPFVQQKPPVAIFKREPQRIREKSLSYHKQFQPLQERIVPLKSVIISKTPMPFRPTPLVKIVQTMNTKSRMTKKKSKESILPPTNFQTKKTVEMPMIRRKTLPSESQCQQIRETKSTIIKKQQKIPQVRVFNEKYLKAEGKEKGLCLISETKELEHMIRIETHSRRDSCIVNPSYSTKKRESVVNYDTYKNRDKNKSSLLNEVSKLWKFHVEKYTKELEYNI